MSKKTGFTLIELMIVIAVIAIIAAMAIPNLLRAQMSAREGAALSATRSISTAEAGFMSACQRYNTTTGSGDYGTLAQLLAPPQGGQPFIDAQLGAGVKGGYNYVATPTDGTATAPATYNATAIPSGTSAGIKSFFVDDTGVVRFNPAGGTPTTASKPV